jgi:hypothetical protein
MVAAPFQTEGAPCPSLCCCVGCQARRGGVKTGCFRNGTPLILRARKVYSVLKWIITARRVGSEYPSYTSTGCLQKWVITSHIQSSRNTVLCTDRRQFVDNTYYQISGVVHRSRNNSASIVTRLWAGRPGSDSRQGQVFFLLSIVLFRPALGLTPPPV